MKIYTVSSMSKIDYDFSVEMCNHGAFVNKADAIERAKMEFRNMTLMLDMPKNDDEIYWEEDDTYGYYCVSFGINEHYEHHTAYVEEWELTE